MLKALSISSYSDFVKSSSFLFSACLAVCVASVSDRAIIFSTNSHGNTCFADYLFINWPTGYQATEGCTVDYSASLLALSGG